MTQLPAPKTTKFCQECGESINAKAEICPSCGVRQPGMEVERKGKKDRITAALLSFFGGTFGIQYFYLGKTLAGILCLVFCWFFFFPTFLGFLEGIILLLMSDAAFDRKYNK